MSTPEFVTVLKKDKKFDSYLDGSFSKTKRAILQKSFYVNTDKEKATFLLFSKESIKWPNFLILLVKLFRVEWLSLSFGPALACLSLLLVKGESVPMLFFVLSMASLFCFHAAVFALNDYKDHMAGSDRINSLGGSQVIQSGWLTASFVKKLGAIMFSLGALLGAYVLFNQSWLFIGIITAVTILVLMYSYAGPNLKYIGFGEALAFLCFGPLIVFGVSTVLGNAMGLNEYLLSFLFGHLSFLIMQSRQIENIISDSRSGAKSLVTLMGFDSAKKSIVLQIALNWLFFGLFLFMLSPSKVAYVLLLPYGFYSFQIAKSVFSAQSPLSSDLKNLRYKMVDLHVLLSTFVFISFWL